MRLIDADELLKKAYKSDWEWHDRLHTEKQKVVDVEDIDEAPTIEAEPVKHGEWEDVKFSEGVYKGNDDSNDIGLSITSAKCSLCQRYSERLQQYSPKMPAYCSHCGAKMDGDENK